MCLFPFGFLFTSSDVGRRGEMCICLSLGFCFMALIAGDGMIAFVLVRFFVSWLGCSKKR